MPKKKPPRPLGLLASGRLGLRKLVIAVFAVSALEAILILTGALPPVSSYSPGNLLFLLARLVIFIYAGALFSGEGLKKAALAGAILAFADVLVVCLGSLAGKALGKPVLGLAVENAGMLAVLFAVLFLENMVLGALLAGCSAFLYKKFWGCNAPKK